MSLQGIIMKVEKLVIVGGGTAGWMTAAYLYNNNPEIEIVVVDKEVGSPIGVGEATLINFKNFLDECGFELSDWFPKIDAGYKSGILFTNWTKPGNEIWHPFYKGNRLLKYGYSNYPNDVYVHDIWTLNQQYDYKKYAIGTYDVNINHNKVDPSIMAVDGYGYHVDCGKLTMYIQDKLKNAIKIIRSDVVDIAHKENGDIDHLILKNGEIVEGDLFVDCTGFRSILRQADKRVDLSDRLFVDTAVVHPVPYEDRDKEFKPFAECEAVDHGWIWKIGVSSRIGSGMLFNRSVTDPEEAKDYFVKYWNNRIDRDTVRVIDWTPFYNEDQWKGNCVQIGLSAGFVEPLESTGIALITSGATQIHNALREQFYDQNSTDYFNQTMKMYFEDVVDFVAVHYDRNERTTPFWNYVKNKFKPSERMQHHIDLIANPKATLPYKGRFNTIFNGVNFSAILIQMGYPVAPRNIPLSPEEAENIMLRNFVKHDKHRHVAGMLHSQLVDRIFETSII